MLEQKLQKIFELVGAVSTQASLTDIQWYLIFTILMHQCPREITDAIINVHKTGEGQRQTIMAVANAVFEKDSEELNIIGKFKSQTDAITGRRNAAIHSAIYIAEFITPPRIAAAGGSKPSKLAEKDIEKELTELLMVATEHNLELNHFRFALAESVEAVAPLSKPLKLKDGWKDRPAS